MFIQAKDIFHKIKIYGTKKFLYFLIKEFEYHFIRNLILKSYSQSKEDLFIDRYFKEKTSGFYVDVGAFNPHRFNNTKHFYNKGWRGINIEPNTLNYQLFIKDRPGDMNLNIGIGTKKESLIFYELFPQTLSTFSKKIAQEYVKKGHTITRDHLIPVDTLSAIFTKYAPKTKIDFVSIDTEGYDLIVLKSNDWGKFKPQLICIESVLFNRDKNVGSYNDDIESFLMGKNYTKIYDNGLNSVYEYQPTKLL